MTDALAPVGKDQASRPRIVVGVDGSDESVTALRAARDVAVAEGGVLVAVTVWRKPNVDTSFEGGMPDFAADAAAQQARRIATAFGDAAPELRCVVVEGDPVDVLIEQSRGANLLVLADQSPGHFAGRVLGAVAVGCAERATCPILIARPRPRHPVRPRYARAG